MSSQSVRLGIIGAGWPGRKHAEGARGSGGYKLVGVADAIPDRRRQLMSEFGVSREYDDAEALLKDPEIDAVSIALPNDLHAETALAAFKAGKHVLLEKPPARNAREARKIAGAAGKAGKSLLYAFQRRFGPAEQAARQAVSKDYAGTIYHARAAWLRTRGVPEGTGWYTTQARSGGGAMIDLGVQMFDLAWALMGEPRPSHVFAVAQRRMAGLSSAPSDVEDFAAAVVRFEGGATLELSAGWALNQPPQQQGALCRLFGESGCIDVYTPTGAVIYRQFDDKGQSKPTPLKPPKLAGHAALMRHFRDCVLGKAKPAVGAEAGVTLMEVVDAIYRSVQTGRSVEIK